MRKLILFAALAATALPSAALARTHDRHHRQEVRHDKREVRADRRELRRDRHELRRDRREVRRHRNHVRTRYVAPYRSWNYRPVSIGYRLRPAFYGSRYYINGYGAYRLHAPRRYERWIRYGDDLLLVNIRTGRVLQVIHYRYW
jgi:Ni/Co efflux regulator RcnB